MHKMAEENQENTQDIANAVEFNKIRVEMDPEILDLAHLSRYTGGDISLESELLGLFKIQAEQQIGVILAAQDKAEWDMAVHTLKGSAQGIGAVKLAETARKLEDVPFIGAESAKLAVLTELKLDMNKSLDCVERFIEAANR